MSRPVRLSSDTRASRATRVVLTFWYRQCHWFYELCEPEVLHADRCCGLRPNFNR